jgi:hypothetical protein
MIACPAIFIKIYDKVLNLIKEFLMIEQKQFVGTKIIVTIIKSRYKEKCIRILIHHPLVVKYALQNIVLNFMISDMQ